MATKEFHEEISKWKDKRLLFELAKYKYSLSWSHISWNVGILVAILIGIIATQDQIKALSFQDFNFGPLLYIFLLVVLGSAIVLLLRSFDKETNQNYENLSYLSRKMDGQLD